MASRRCLLNLTRHFSSLPHHHLRTISSSSPNTQTLCPKTHLPKSISTHHFNLSLLSRHFSTSHNSSDEDDDDDEEDAEFESEEEEENDELKSAEEIAQEAADIGYKVVGPVGDSQSPFKPYEPVFAIVQIGAHQFKVSNGDTISTEKLKYCDVNDMLILNKVLMLGSRTQTIIGRPILPNASVHVVVEEHALDAKVIIFKKKRRKNYRRKNGHRQELTRLRIIDIQGIEKPETPEPKKKAEPKKVKSPSKKPEKVAVAA